MGIYGVWAEVFALAGLAMLSHPDLIKLVHGLLYDFWIISQDAGLEVTRVISFHADAGTSKIGTTDISLFATPDKVGTGTEDIVTLCKDKGLKSPEYHQEEDFRVVIWRQGGQATGQVKGQVAGQVKETIRRLVLAIGGQTLTRKEIMEKAEARSYVRSYFSSGMGPYYRYHHGENKLSPKQQEDILKIIANYCSIEGVKFDHYVAEWDFDYK